jgi:hypothetical protein
MLMGPSRPPVAGARSARLVIRLHGRGSDGDGNRRPERQGGKCETDRLAHIKKPGAVTTYGSPWWLVRLYMGDPEKKAVKLGNPE